MKKTGQFILCILILIVAGSAIYSYGFKPLGEGLPDSMRKTYQLHAYGIYVHIFGAVVALLIGPLQFSTRLRQQRRQLHRWLGRIYLSVGVVVGGLSGLYMSMFANGGPVVKLGFACLALVWLYTGFMAYKSIRAGDVVQHRAYMVRNFSLTLAAVSLRVYLPLSMMAGADFDTAYAVIAWMCWVPNLVLGEMLINRSGKRAAMTNVSTGAQVG